MFVASFCSLQVQSPISANGASYTDPFYLELLTSKALPGGIWNCSDSAHFTATMRLG